MPRRFEFDRYLRDFHTLTPSERDAIIRRVAREAKAERAEAIRELFRRFGSGVARMFDKAWRRYRQRQRLRATATQLYGMDDRELKDIGLRRGDIEFVLSGVKDPTRRPRTARSRQTFRSVDHSSPRLDPTQRATGPLVLRKECAG